MITTEHQTILDNELRKCRSDLERLGADINGYSGGSPEGDVWQFTFSFECPLAPDRASAEIGIYWLHGWGKEPENEIRIYRTASIFRKGSTSSYESREDYRRPVVGVPLSLREIIVEAMQECKSEIEKASNKSINFAPSAPDS
ncbi:hypothetical protein [Microbulbifer sp. SAOS-129_SWC]|uniref:hypothetical protein n=1 Tax=Microbulbifer sp. SAOS-129_SWC TaxID=3145235 RepID=UPI0032173E88